jgi:hypothetical protein
MAGFWSFFFLLLVVEGEQKGKNGRALGSVGEGLNKKRASMPFVLGEHGSQKPVHHHIWAMRESMPHTIFINPFFFLPFRWREIWDFLLKRSKNKS